MTWLEEPLPPADHDAYRRLRAESPVAIATGEHEPDEAGLVTIATSGVTDFVQADLCSGRRPLARPAGVRRGPRRRPQFAFHSWGTLLEVITAAQLGVCWPSDVVPWLEYPLHANDGRVGIYPFPLADDVLAEPLDVRDGVLHCRAARPRRDGRRERDRAIPVPARSLVDVPAPLAGPRARRGGRPQHPERVRERPRLTRQRIR